MNKGETAFLSRHFSSSSSSVSNPEVWKENSDSWVSRWLPPAIQPFALTARVDKPTGTWLLALPCFWSIALAAPPGEWPDLHLLGLFAVGAFLLRGAGCTVNDLLDKDLDRQVTRTRTRPLASGTMSPDAAVGFLGLQLLLGLGVLLQLNTFSQVLGASSLLLVGTYPLMKRITFWPQAYLGLTINWGALLGWAAVRGELDLPVVLPLYISSICWTIFYDTIYAHQDKADDAVVGVKSTALLFGNNTTMYLAAFGAASIASLAATGAETNLGWPYFAALTAGAGHLFWQLRTVDYSSRSNCLARFNSNPKYGSIILTGIIFGRLMAT